jgi:hypothetical protein
VRKREYQASRYDPTGEVDLESPDEVESATQSILERMYGNRYDAALFGHGIEHLVRCYRGQESGLQRSDTPYHDLRHALETGLTMARLLEANAKSDAANGAGHIDGRHALLGILLALFHDIGLLRRENEAHLPGAVFTPIHEERGVEFMRDYLSKTALSSLADKAELIMSTKLVFKIPDSWSAPDRRMASMVASADMLCQLADCCYLEKCREFLFQEFTAFGVAGTPDSTYPDPETLMVKSPGFYTNVVIPRLEDDFRGVYRLMKTYYSGADPYQESILKNFGYLNDVLASRDFSRLRRHPRSYIGDAGQSGSKINH